MNPLAWPRQKKAALALALLVGIVLGVVIGYFVYASSRGGGGAVSFSSWLEGSLQFRRPGIWWGLTGGAVAAALFYVRLLVPR